MLGEGTTDNIGSGGTVEQKFSINITNTRAKCCLSLQYNGDNLVLMPSQKKHHLKEMFMVFQSIKMLPEF